jgi:hypothetical protein
MWPGLADPARAGEGRLLALTGLEELPDALTNGHGTCLTSKGRHEGAHDINPWLDCIMTATYLLS